MATARARAPLTASSSANLPWSSLGERSEGTGGRRGARVGMAGETVAMPMPEAEWMRLARPATHCFTEYIVQPTYWTTRRAPRMHGETLYRDALIRAFEVECRLGIRGASMPVLVRVSYS